MTVHEKRSVMVEDQVRSYAERVGLNIESEGIETVVGDMIADLLHHVVAKTGCDPADALNAVSSGLMHYTAQSQVPVEDYQVDIGPEVGVSVAVEFEGQVWSCGVGANVETAPPRI